MYYKIGIKGSLPSCLGQNLLDATVLSMAHIHAYIHPSEPFDEPVKNFTFHYQNSPPYETRD